MTHTNDDFDAPGDEPRQAPTVRDEIPPMDFDSPHSRHDRSGQIEDNPRPDLARMDARRSYVNDLGRNFEHKSRPGEPSCGSPYTLVIETSRELNAHRKGRE